MKRISFTPDFSQVISKGKRSGKCLNGFQTDSQVASTWLKPGENENLKVPRPVNSDSYCHESAKPKIELNCEPRVISTAQI